jgi:hypothetical protein
MRCISAVIVVFLLLPLTGCPAGQEKVEALTEEMLAVMQESTSVMEYIKDGRVWKVRQPDTRGLPQDAFPNRSHPIGSRR